MAETPHTSQTFETPDFAPAERRRSIAAALACIAAVGVGLGATLPLLALRMEAMGASATVIGLNTAMVGLAHIIFTPMVPHILRRVPMMTFLLVCIAVAAVANMGFYLVPDVTVWFPLRFVMSSALAGLFIVSEIWINQLAEERSRGRVIGVYATIFAGAFALGPVMLLAAGTDGIFPFAMTAGLIVSAVIPLRFARGLMPEVKERPTKRFAAFLVAAPAATFAALIYGAVETQVFNLLPVFAVRSGSSEAIAALVLTVFAAGNVVLQIPIGMLADRVDRRAVLAGCAAVGVIGPALLPYAADDPWLLYPVLFLYGGVVVGLYSVGLALLGQRFRGADLAAANAAFVVMYSAGALLGPSLGGAAMDWRDPNGLALSLGGVAALYLLLTVWRMWRAGPASPPPRET